MTRTEGIKKLNESLCSIGMDPMASLIEGNVRRARSSELFPCMVEAIDSYSVMVRNERTEKLLRRSRIPHPCYFSDIWPYEARKLDMEQLEYLMDLDFVRSSRNVVFQGAGGTGKSWFASALATRACEEGFKVRWVEFPALLRELRNKEAMGGTALDSRMKFYCRFDLLCIDEFCNEDPDRIRKDSYLVHELIRKLEEKRVPLLLTMQFDSNSTENFFTPTGIGESIKGRILRNGTITVNFCGPNLHTYKPGS